MAGRSFVLTVMSPKGGLALRTFSDLRNEEGVKDGLVASYFWQSGCNDLQFAGRPDLLQLTGGQVVQAFIRTPSGMRSVFYGAVPDGETPEPAETFFNFTASARALLLATGCRGDRFTAQDTATIAHTLASSYKHASLKVRASDFPPSGTVLDTFVARGELASVLKQLLEATGDAAYGTGLDPDGYIFFKPNRQTREVDYALSDYEDLPLSGAALQTAINWRLEPGELGSYAGPYEPVDLNYLSVPDPALHDLYGYERQRVIPLSAFASVPDSEIASSANFTNPANATAYESVTPAVHTTGVGTLQIANTDPLVYGIRLVYKLTDDAGEVLLRAKTNTTTYFEIPLEKSDADEWKDIPITLPPHAVGFQRWDWFRLTAQAGGTFSVLGFYPLRLDTTRLDAATQVVVPEKRPGQIMEPGIQDCAATIRLTGAPGGARDSPNAGVRWGWTPDKGAQTATDLETSTYDLDDPQLERVSGYYRRKT